MNMKESNIEKISYLLISDFIFEMSLNNLRALINDFTEKYDF